MEWAGEDALVTEIAFYHGGTPLYVLRGRRGDSGYWHEVCLYGIGRVSQHPAPRIGDTVQASELFAILDAEIADAGVRLDQLVSPLRSMRSILEPGAGRGRGSNKKAPTEVFSINVRLHLVPADRR